MVFALASILIGVLVNIMRPDGLIFIAQDLPTIIKLPITKNSEQPVLAIVDLDQAKALYDRGVVFIDSREPEYWQEGHIKNSWNFSSELELVFSLDSLQGKTKPLVTYCDEDECGSSKDMAYLLQEFGFTQIYVFKGGWKEWLTAGYPVAP